MSTEPSTDFLDYLEQRARATRTARNRTVIALGTALTLLTAVVIVAAQSGWNTPLILSVVFGALSTLGIAGLARMAYADARQARALVDAIAATTVAGPDV